jgi:hypothetical protein
MASRLTLFVELELINIICPTLITSKFNLELITTTLFPWKLEDYNTSHTHTQTIHIFPLKNTHAIYGKPIYTMFT